MGRNCLSDSYLSPEVTIKCRIFSESLIIFRLGEPFQLINAQGSRKLRSRTRKSLIFSVIVAAGVTGAFAAFQSDGARALVMDQVSRLHDGVSQLAMSTGLTSCRIKGNISINSGRRIYHMPGQEDYSRTRIRAEYGERWFCTEAEAMAAGWRRANN
jgi:hypothetical protein